MSETIFAEVIGLSEANTVTTPMDPNVKLVKDDSYSKKVDPIQYQFTVTCSKSYTPDIAHAVGLVSKFNSAPTQAHLTAVKRIFRYLKGTIDLKLQYESTGGKLLASQTVSLAIAWRRYQQACLLLDNRID